MNEKGGGAILGAIAIIHDAFRPSVAGCQSGLVRCSKKIAKWQGQREGESGVEWWQGESATCCRLWLLWGVVCASLIRCQESPWCRVEFQRFSAAPLLAYWLPSAD